MALSHTIYKGFEILIGTAVYRAGAGGIVVPNATTERLGYDIDALAWDLRRCTKARWGTGTTMQKAILSGCFAFHWKPEEYTALMYDWKWWETVLERECTGWVVG